MIKITNTSGDILGNYIPRDGKYKGTLHFNFDLASKFSLDPPPLNNEFVLKIQNLNPFMLKKSVNIFGKKIENVL